jgi:hypothetical protein
MPRSTPRLLALVLALAALGLSPAAVRADDITARTLAPAQLQDEFVRCGYQLPGGNRPGQYFAVRGPNVDPRDNPRILMVVVYPDVASAAEAHRRAHERAEAKIGIPVPMSDDHGPQLLVGYGGSVWRNNVAMLQTTLRTLSGLYYEDIQTGEAKVIDPSAFDLGFATRFGPYAVDSDFVMCLEDMQAELAIGPPGPGAARGVPLVEALVLNGRPM